MQTRFLVFIIGFACVGLPASTHTRLARSVPADGATLEAPPAHVELHFQGKVQVRYSSVQVKDPKGEELRTEAPLEPMGDRAFRAAIRQDGGAGRYEVRWSALSADGHHIEGSFSFSVGVARPPSVARDKPGSLKSDS